MSNSDNSDYLKNIPAVITDSKEYYRRYSKCLKYIRNYGIDIENRPYDIIQFFFPKNPEVRDEIEHQYPELFL